jgi:predicted O-methyltransferase YrrM
MANFIVEKSVERYLHDLIPRRDPLLAEMEDRARREDIKIIGPLSGRLLALLVELTGARRIFEMGSAIGYSTIWMARAAGPKAEIYYSDGDPGRARDAQGYLRRAAVDRRVHVQVGDALKLLRKSKGRFDIIFCDVDKQQYPAAFRLALPRLRRGGLFVADNVLWHGAVSERARDTSTRAIQTFNRLVYASIELFPVIVPLRDGVVVCRRR